MDDTNLMDTKQALLLLNRVAYVGPRTIKKILTYWPEPEEVFDLSINADGRTI